MTAFHDVSNTRLEIAVAGSGLQNLLENPSGALGAWSWLTPVASTAMTVTAGLRFQTFPSQAAYWTSDFMPIAAGSYAAARFDTLAGSGSHNVKVRFQWYDSSKTLLSSSAQTSGYTGTAQTNYVPAAQAPASTAYMKIRFDFYNGTGNPSANANYTFARAMVTVAATNSFTTVRVNRVTNPGFETNTTGWTAAFEGAAGTFARSTAQAWSGTASARLTAATGTTRMSASISGATVGGRDHTAQVQLLAGSTGRLGRLTLAFFAADGRRVGLTPIVQGVDNSSTWSLAKTSAYTSPAEAVSWTITVSYGDGATAIPSGETHYFDAAMVERTTTGSYFDGNSTTGGTLTYTWSGTANASTSTESNTAFDYVEPVTWQNILGETQSIVITREALNLGDISADVLSPALDPAVVDTLRTGTKIRLVTYTATAGKWDTVFTGKILKTPTVYLKDKNPGGLLRVRIGLTGVDANGALSQRGEKRGVATVAELPYLFEGKGVPWNCNGSGNQVPSAAIVSNNPAASMLDQIAITRDTVRGYAWCDRYGVEEVWDAASMPGTVQTFSDAAGASLSYTDISVDRDVDSCINSVTVKWLRTSATGDTQEITYGPYVDQASIDLWDVHSAEFTIHGATEDPATIAAYAAAVLAANSTPAIKCNSLTFSVQSDWTMNRATVLDLYARVHVTYGTVFDGDLRITSIKHTITPDKWLVEYGFSSVTSVASPTWTPSPPAEGLVDGVWNAVTYQNSWVDFGSTFAPAKYMRKNGVVYLKGFVKNGALGSPCFTLPAGFRPAETNVFASVDSTVTTGPASAGTAHTHQITGLAIRVDVRANGEVSTVVPATGTSANAYVSLSGISFPAEQ